MKKVVLALAFIFALGLTTKVSAQDAPKPKKQFGWTKVYMDEIGISDEVQAKIEAVKAENNAEMKAVRENSALSSEEKKVQLAQLNKKRGLGIYALLTPEQKKKAAEIITRLKKENEETGE